MSVAPIEQQAPFSPEVQRQLINWLSQPEGVDVELLGGQLRPKAMAKLRHGRAQMAISSQLFHMDALGVSASDGEPPGSPIRWWLSLEVDIYIGGEGMRPDVAGWRLDRNPSPPPETNVANHLGVITVVPDWVCEILSVSTTGRDVGTTKDRGIKWKAYQRAGVEWYWIVDLEHESLTVYQRTARSYEVVEMVGRGEVVRLPPFETVELSVTPLFLSDPKPSP